MISFAKASSGIVGPPDPPPVNRTLTVSFFINIDSFGIPYLISNIALRYGSGQNEGYYF